MSKIALSPEEIKILIEVLEGLIGYIASKTRLSYEDEARLIAIQDRLNKLKSKEENLANQ